MLREPAWRGTYPAEGDSPVAELLFGGELIGDVRLVAGQARVALYPATRGVREFDFDQFIATVEAAHHWVRGNKGGNFANPS